MNGSIQGSSSLGRVVQPEPAFGRIILRQAATELLRRNGACLRCKQVQRLQLVPHRPAHTHCHDDVCGQRQAHQQPGPAPAHRGIRAIDRLAGPQVAACQRRRRDLEVAHAQVLGRLGRSELGVGVQQAAVGSPDLEPVAAAHRRVVAQPRQHRGLAATAGLLLHHVGDQLTALPHCRRSSALRSFSSIDTDNHVPANSALITNIVNSASLRNSRRLIEWLQATVVQGRSIGRAPQARSPCRARCAAQEQEQVRIVKLLRLAPDYEFVIWLSGNGRLGVSDFVLWSASNPYLVPNPQALTFALKELTMKTTHRVDPRCRPCPVF